MNNNLNEIIRDFLENVEVANEMLKKYLNTDEPHNWSHPIEQVGLLDGRFKYFFHGVGCAVHISRTEVVDFDYGANGRIDGFDHWRLWSFVDDRKAKYSLVTSEDIKQWLDEAVKSGEIERSITEKYGSLFFFAKNT